MIFLYFPSIFLYFPVIFLSLEEAVVLYKASTPSARSPSWLEAVQTRALEIVIPGSRDEPNITPTPS